MSQLISISISADSLRDAPFVEGKNGKKYFGLTVSVNDTADQYGKNVQVWSEQSKQEREAKKTRHFVGNGKVVYGHGKIANGMQTPSAPSKSPVDDGLPF